MTKTQSETEFNKKLHELIADIQQRAKKQFEYNLETNTRMGIMKVEECASHAVENGIVGAISKMNEWDTDKACLFAYHILEDSNCHGEARELVKFIPQYQ